jgi:hypothetical protein
MRGALGVSLVVDGSAGGCVDLGIVLDPGTRKKVCNYNSVTAPLQQPDSDPGGEDVQ